MKLMCIWIYTVITFSWCWQMQVHLIWSFSKWRNFKRLLNFIRGLCTHMRAHTHFFGNFSWAVSIFHLAGFKPRSFSFFCAAVLWFVNSKFEKKPCSNDANTADVLPAFWNFPLTLRCTPCVRGGYASRHSRETPGSLLIILLLNKVICYSCMWL